MGNRTQQTIIQKFKRQIFGICYSIWSINNIRYSSIYKGGPSPEEKIISQDPIITQEELNEINEKLDNLENNQNTEEKGEYQTVNQIKQKILEDLEAEKVYYKIVTNEGDSDYSLISFVIWTEENENVYIYQYRKYEEGYILNLAMKSSSMTKNELEGQEDGIWGKQKILNK